MLKDDQSKPERYTMESLPVSFLDGRNVLPQCSLKPLINLEANGKGYFIMAWSQLSAAKTFNLEKSSGDI